MTGEVQLSKTVADLQAQIQTLMKDGGVAKHKEEIEKLNQQIADAISGHAEENGGKVVDTTQVDISTEMGATFTAKQKTADQGIIDATKQHSGDAVGKKKANEQIVEDYGYRDENGRLLTEDEAKAKIKELDKQKKALEKELKQAEKDWKKAMKSDNETLADELEAKYDQLSEQYQVFKYQYDKDIAALRVNAEKKGAIKGIRKAADHNVENYENVQQVATEHPTMKKSDLSAEEYRALKQLQKYGEKQIKKAEASGDAKKIKDAHAKYDHYLSMIKEDGSIDTQAVQNVLVDFTGGDQNLNLDELKLVKSKLNVGNSNLVSKGDVKDLFEKFGFGTEGGLKTKLAAAGTAAGTAAAGNAIGYLMGGHSHKSASASASDSKTVVAEGESVTKIIKITDPKTGHVEKVSVTAQGGTATASCDVFCEAVATACAKVPILGQLAGPVLAGVTAFILTEGKTEDAFNGASVEEVLEDLSLVKNADNQAIINKIQDLPLDDRIKAAVLKASMGEGVTANTEELERAYQDLLKTQEAIGNMQVTDDNGDDDIVTPPPGDDDDGDDVVTPPSGDDDDGGDETPCTKMEDRSSHSDAIPSVQVKGHGQSPYWVAKAYVMPDGSELNAKQRAELQKLLGKSDNLPVQQHGNFNGCKIGYSYKNEITLSDGTVVKLADDAAARIGTGKMAKTRVTYRNGKQVTEVRWVDCNSGNAVNGDAGQWHTPDAHEQSLLKK